VLAAVRSGEIECVAALLADSTPFGAQQSQELVKQAALAGFFDILRLLLHHEKIESVSVSAALISAARHDRAECMVELLAVPGIDVNWRSPDKRTPLHTAIDFGSRAIIRILYGRLDINLNIKNGVFLLFFKGVRFGFS
jgi:ankyrin repeat protein